MLPVNSRDHNLSNTDWLAMKDLAEEHNSLSRRLIKVLE